MLDELAVESHPRGAVARQVHPIGRVGWRGLVLDETPNVVVPALLGSRLPSVAWLMWIELWLPSGGEVGPAVTCLVGNACCPSPLSSPERGVPCGDA